MSIGEAIQILVVILPVYLVALGIAYIHKKYRQRTK